MPRLLSAGEPGGDIRVDPSAPSDVTPRNCITAAMATQFAATEPQTPVIVGIAPLSGADRGQEFIDFGFQATAFTCERLGGGEHLT
jgi:hypothetical protein